MKYSIKVKGDNNLNTEDVGRVSHALATRSLCYLPRSNSHTPFHSFPPSYDLQDVHRWIF
jgi:hypothetical protein